MQSEPLQLLRRVAGCAPETAQAVGRVCPSAQSAPSTGSV